MKNTASTSVSYEKKSSKEINPYQWREYMQTKKQSQAKSRLLGLTRLKVGRN